MAKAPSVYMPFAAICVLTASALAWADETSPKLRRETRIHALESAASISDLADRTRSEKAAGVLKSSGTLVPTESVAEGGVAGLVNDLCANSLPINGPGPFAFNSGAGMGTDGPTHAACSFNGQTQINNDEWFCWTAPAVSPCYTEGEFVFSTCGSNIDTKAAIYTGCSCANLESALLACNDDSCGVQSSISFNPVAGQQYLIRLGTFPGAAGGAGQFSIACHANELPCEQSSDNCQIPSQEDGINSNGSEFTVADDFTPTTSGNVTSLCFWGGYVATVGGTDCRGVLPDNFIVRYYSSVNGRPGALLATYSQAGGTLAVTGPEPTGLFITGSVAEYEFSATHAPLPVNAGSCYWIEITNEIAGCSWFWELSNVENERAFQDGRAPEIEPDGYDPEETIVGDMAFCVGRPLGDSTTCYPPVPANDNCANAQPISAAGDILYDLTSATQDGPAYQACLSFGQTQIAHDVWYCWTAPCTATAFVRTCGDTTADTKLAVYEGCTCPPSESAVIACNDDKCGTEGFQSMATFEAVQGQSYLIRVGTYPLAAGGAGILHVTCGPPDHPSCPGTGSCCDSQDGMGCGNETCCETVCACDPFCCDTEWDGGCATTGFADSGCGADELCGCGATCGSPNAGDCCTGHDNPACDDAVCCQTVCECDTFCCETEWDAFCAANGSIPGCGAAVLCADLCADNCPIGGITAVSPPNNIVDARRYLAPGDPPTPEGISQIAVSGPAGAEPGCFALCETGVSGSPNFVTNVNENNGVYTLTLNRPITRGNATTITYTDTNSTATTLTYISHPANVNNNSVSDAGDVTSLVLHLMAGTALPWGLASGDINRSNAINALDILTLVDMLNKAAPYNDETWLGYPKPAAAPFCP